MANREQINIEAGDILRAAVSIMEDAESRYTTPKFVSQTFRNNAAVAWRDVLRRENINPETLGRIIGNKSRWNIELSKYFAIRFLTYLMKKMPPDKVRINPDEIVDMAKRKENIWLDNYRGFFPYFVQKGVTLILDQKKWLSIKAKVPYPNREGSVFYKWYTMRYGRNPNNSNVSLQKMPPIQLSYNREKKRWSSEGYSESLKGELCNFSYGDICRTIKFVCEASLEIVVGTFTQEKYTEFLEVPERSKQRLMPTKLCDIVNLIQRVNYQFNIVLMGKGFVQDSDAPLLLNVESDVISETYRINGAVEDTVYFIYGTESEIEDLLEDLSQIQSAYIGDLFNPHDVNMYSHGTDEKLMGIIFQTSSDPYESNGDMDIWIEPLDILSYEVLTDFEIHDYFY